MITLVVEDQEHVIPKAYLSEMGTMIQDLVQDTTNPVVNLSMPFTLTQPDAVLNLYC